MSYQIPTVNVQQFNEFIKLVGLYYSQPSNPEVREFALRFAQAKCWYSQGLIEELQMSRQSTPYGFPIQKLPDQAPVDLEEYVTMYWPGSLLTTVQQFPQTNDVQPGLQLTETECSVNRPPLLMEARPLTVTDGHNHRSYLVDFTPEFIANCRRIGQLSLFGEAPLYEKGLLVTTFAASFPKSLAHPVEDDVFCFYRNNFLIDQDPRAHTPGQHYVQAIFHDVATRQILLSKRTMNVHLYKDAFQAAAAGKVDIGDCLGKAVIKEVYEEIGVRISVHQKHYLYSYRHIDSNETETFVHTFMFPFSAGKFPDGSLMLPFVNKEPNKATDLRWYHENQLFHRKTPALSSYLDLIHRHLEPGWLLDHNREPDSAFVSPVALIQPRNTSTMQLQVQVHHYPRSLKKG